MAEGVVRGFGGARGRVGVQLEKGCSKTSDRLVLKL